MALSNAARRAIAIRNKIKNREMTASSVVVANDNVERRAARRPRGMSPSLTQACVDAAGFAEHAA